MGKPIAVTRQEFSAQDLRVLAAATRDGAVVRRLLAIALILEGHSRAEAVWHSSPAMAKPPARHG